MESMIFILKFSLCALLHNIEFDHDDEIFATADVSRPTKVSNISMIVNEPLEAHCPVVEHLHLWYLTVYKPTTTALLVFFLQYGTCCLGFILNKFVVS
ncbi:putative E3 ubiquitin-protein ligase COP1 [Helianthus anomalus]